MKVFFRYIEFFFYIAFNWSPWLAFFMLYHDIRGGRKYGINTFVRVPLSELTVQADISNSSPYEAVNYYILEKLLSSFKELSSERSIVDLGCGKGRVMVVAGHFGFKHVKGIDFAKELCEEARLNMAKTKLLVPGIDWEVIHVNVLDYSISPGDAVFFMFNPFAEETLNGFLDKLETSCHRHPRRTWFLYASPKHGITLEERGYSMLYHTSFMNLEGIIFSKNA